MMALIYVGYALVPVLSYALSMCMEQDFGAVDGPRFTRCDACGVVPAGHICRQGVE